MPPKWVERRFILKPFPAKCFEGSVVIEFFISDSAKTLKDLFDFLNFIERGRRQNTTRLAFAGKALCAFHDYLGAKNIEYSTFGIHEFSEAQFTPPILTAFDPPDIRATLFSLRQPGGEPRMEGGLKNLIPPRSVNWRMRNSRDAEWIATILPATAETICSARQEAQVVVGRAAMAPAAERGSFYGFYFGWQMDGEKRSEDMIAELEVATTALKDKLDPEIQTAIDNADPTLTAREMDILRLASEGAQRADMAHALGVSLATVDQNLAKMRKRLGGRTVAEAVAKGYAYGLI